jgi:hypothetical protein
MNTQKFVAALSLESIKTAILVNKSCLVFSLESIKTAILVNKSCLVFSLESINENQYNHSVKVISNLKEVRSILESLDMNTQKFVAAKEKLSECINLVRTETLHDDQTASAMGLLWYSCTIFQPKSDESASLVIM